jgi:acetyltransferase-like isoleucine patch superfamily enzyme
MTEQPTTQAITRQELAGCKKAVYLALLCLCRVLTALPALLYFVSGRRAAVFQSLMQCACLLPTFAGLFTRLALLQWMAGKCGRRVTVHLGTLFSTPQVELGENIYIGAFCNVGWALIGDYVVLGSNVQITSGKHQHFYERTDIPIALQGGRKTPVRIGRGSWLGNGSIVMADVGEECVVGAGAVVVNPLPPWSVAVGSPARVVADRRSPPPATEA